MKAKPTLYVDTNVLSVLHYFGDNIRATAQQMVTREWWADERSGFRVYSSRVTESELRAGGFPGQGKAIALCRRMKYLPVRRRSNFAPKR